MDSNQRYRLPRPSPLADLVRCSPRRNEPAPIPAAKTSVVTERKNTALGASQLSTCAKQFKHHADGGIAASESASSAKSLLPLTNTTAFSKSVFSAFFSCSLSFFVSLLPFLHSSSCSLWTLKEGLLARGAGAMKGFMADLPFRVRRFLSDSHSLSASTMLRPVTDGPSFEVATHLRLSFKTQNPRPSAATHQAGNAKCFGKRLRSQLQNAMDCLACRYPQNIRHHDHSISLGLFSMRRRPQRISTCPRLKRRRNPTMTKPWSNTGHHLHLSTITDGHRVPASTIRQDSRVLWQ